MGRVRPSRFTHLLVISELEIGNNSAEALPIARDHGWDWGLFSLALTGWPMAVPTQG